LSLMVVALAVPRGQNGTVRDEPDKCKCEIELFFIS
jgi:hypothetical protein